MKLVFPIVLLLISGFISAQNYPLTGHLQNINEKDIYFGETNTLLRPATGVENALYDSLIFHFSKSERKTCLGRKIFDEHLMIGKDSNFIILLNPIIDFSLNHQLLGKGYHNTRGVFLNGNLSNRIFFNSSFTESQAVLPSAAKGFFIQFGTIPGYGRVKELARNSEYDFGAAYGSFSIKATENVNFTLGYDKLFIGDGYRSLILSDFSAPLMYFKSSIKFGKFEYNNIFSKALNPNFNNVMDLENPVSANSKYPSKFISYNTLTYKLNQSWQISLVEALVMSEDLAGWKVPIYSLIPYIRTAYIEHKNQLTNNLTGINLTWQNSKIGIVYSQLIIDRFYDWYYPIAAFQLGYKSFDFAGIEDLYLQVEYNRVPRGMYSHRNNEIHYGHYNQALAHPAGAGFNEIIAIADYKLNRFELVAKAVFLKYASSYNLFNQQNIYNYYSVFPTTLAVFERSPYLIADCMLIYNLNPSYRLQIFAGISSHIVIDSGNTSHFVQAGIRTALRSNYYDY